MLLLPVAVAIPGLLATFIYLRVPGHRFYRSVYFFPAVLSPVIVGAIFNLLLAFDGPSTPSSGRSVSIRSTGSVTRASRCSWWSACTSGPPSAWPWWCSSPDSPRWIPRCWTLPGWTGVTAPGGLARDRAELSRTIQFVFVTTMIGMLTSMFGLLYVMTSGGPEGSTYLPEFYIWKQQGQMNRPVSRRPRRRSSS
ncbi:hypothetical protein NKG94_21765 [Micromonospora sp. M12]